MCERDHGSHWGDIFRDPFADTGYYGAPSYNDPQYYDFHYGRDDVSRRSHAEERYLHAAALTHNLFSPTTETYRSGNEGGFDGTVYIEPSSSSSSPGESMYAGDEWSSEHSDDFGKFHQMVPIRHVPKINGEIPSFDEATLDHQRLIERLKVYDLVEHKVKGDGNCQFRALSDQLYQSPEHHEFVRQQVISQLRTHRDMYQGYVPMAYDQYLEKLSRNGEWGDHVTLQAAADLYGIKFFVMTSFKDTCYIEILPKVQKSTRVIFLSFWAEVHYNSIYPQGEDHFKF